MRVGAWLIVIVYHISSKRSRSHFGNNAGHVYKIIIIIIVIYCRSFYHFRTKLVAYTRIRSVLFYTLLLFRYPFFRRICS
uniref:Uncharacterized protein n=1 Tax=Anopheles darlingi TaxID=43151 RepID=A0A2M4D7Y8_ANODA